MTKFKITYTDPETEEEISVIQDFFDSGAIRAIEWAEDYAYALTDKGSYSIKKLV